MLGFLTKWGRLHLRILLPSLLTVLLFVIAIFAIYIPHQRRALMDLKRKMIKELTQSAWSVLDYCYRLERQGVLDRDEAQQQAASAIREMRYGSQLKDYFWINDLGPILIVHPYRSDLVGTDVADLTDSTGKFLIREFIEVARRDGAGYVDYMWQWMDNPDQIVPKISYVKLFEPWGWLVGTGIYVEDIRAETSSMTRNLVICSVAILIIMILITSYSAWHGIVLENERNSALEKLHDTIRELESKNAELERFVYTVSHDLKSPLVTIKGFAGLLEQDALSADNEKVKTDITFINDAVNKMSQLLEELLELSRIGNASQPNDRIDMNQLVQETLKFSQMNSKSKKIDITVESDLPVIVGDRYRISEVFQNLIENAIKYSSDKPEPQITIGTRNHNGELVYYIRDNGIGIDKQYHQKVFSLFEQLDPNVEGSGVGLTIVKRIIEVHGGEIWIESEGTGCGTTFCFTLPQSAHNSPDSN